MLYCSVANKRVNLNVQGFFTSETRFVGATFPVVPVGTVVEKLVFDTPDGLHTLVFFSQFDGNIERGSGKTQRLEHVSNAETHLGLFWDEGGKTVAKSASDMSAGELDRFNSFILSSADILVMNALGRIVYSWSPTKVNAIDPDWTYKSVSIDSMLAYITKRLTLEELDSLAESEQEARDELAELHETNRQLVHNLHKAVGAATEELHRATNLAIALNNLADWVEHMLENRFLRLLLTLSRPSTTMAVITVIKDRHLEGVTLEGLMNDRANPVD